MNLTLTLALRYLAGRKLRSFLTTLAIAFGVLLIFGMNSLLPAFFQAFQANAMAAANQFDAIIAAKTGAAFSEDVIGQVNAVAGVQAASPSLERSISLPPDYFDHDAATPDRSPVVALVGVQPASARALSAFIMVSGRFLEEDDRRSAVIAESLAETAGVGHGDSLSLPTPTGLVDLTVVGILPQRLLPGNEEVYVTLADAQDLFAMPGQINVIRANFNTVDADTRRKIYQDISTTLGEGFALGALQENAEILSNIQIAQVVFNLLGALGLLMGAFIILNTFRTIVAERRRDIGMLRAIGAERGTVAWIILLEGLIQGVIGAAAGLVLGYLFARLLLAAVSPILRQFLNLPFNAIPIQPGLVAVSILAGVGVTLLASWLPAYSASRLSPLEALRPAVGG
ncbi:MAG: FtsX-like permease family protein, partial [Chloroflexi bacterium]|nr:FtsX-like permease family protein [Chloroflexota bacterium]